MKRFRDPKVTQGFKDEEAQTFQPLPWVYWSKTDHQFYIKGWNIGQLAITMIQLAFVFLVCAWIYALAHQPEPAALFRPSLPVTSLQSRKELSLRLRPLLMEYWQAHPEICGVAAPYLNRFYNYLVINLQGQVVELFNLDVWLDEKAKPLLVEELSPLCDIELNSTLQTHHEREEDRPGRKIERFSSIWIKYDTLLEQEKRILVSNLDDSMCLQYFYDILQGEWPCLNQSIPT
jgi:hypothetical protein